MKFRIFTLLAMAGILLSACDDAQLTVGNSLTDSVDKITITTEVFGVPTASVPSGPVLSRSTKGSLGRIKDPETGAYVTADFMVQFHTLDGFRFPAHQEGTLVCDSAEIRLFYNSVYGDKQNTMSLTACDMSKPMEENVSYATDFDPEKNGYVRSEAEGGLRAHCTYTLKDNSESSSVTSSTDYVDNIRIRLDEPYKDASGNTHANYGAYVISRYKADPSLFSTSYRFVHNVVPGFYIKHNAGLGSMPEIMMSRLNISFHYKPLDKDTVITGTTSFAGTEEVLQATRITTDAASLDKLINDASCTYVKSPAGIFTQMQLPVDQIMNTHEGDSISMAAVSLQSYDKPQGDYTLARPSALLMVQADSLSTFFSERKVANNKTTFITLIDGLAYNFPNVATLVKKMYETKTQGLATDPKWLEKHPSWNKVFIVPVYVTYSTYGSTTYYSSITHDMGLTGARFVGGAANPDAVKMKVIYNKFSQ